MRDRSTWALLAAMALVTGALWFSGNWARLRSEVGTGRAGAVPTAPEAPGHGLPRPNPSRTDVPQAQDSAGVAAAPEWLRAAPDADRLRREARANPHVTPPSLRRFAAELGAASDRLAPDDRAGATAFMEDLRRCVVEGPRPPTVEALCLSGAADLRDRFPHLAGEYERLRGRASPEARRLVEALAGLRSGGA
jgi:hypothetical protein